MSISLPIARPATLDDAPAITAIYNEGIASRLATFETRLREVDDIKAWFAAGYRVTVAEIDGVVAGFASTSSYRARPCYEGVLEFSVYVGRLWHRQGVGQAALALLCQLARQHGAWKLLSRIFPENTASLAMCAKADFRHVGIYEKHAQLDGVWRDVVIMEKLLLE